MVFVVYEFGAAVKIRLKASRVFSLYKHKGFCAAVKALTQLKFKRRATAVLESLVIALHGNSTGLRRTRQYLAKTWDVIIV